MTADHPTPAPARLTPTPEAWALAEREARIQGYAGGPHRLSFAAGWYGAREELAAELARRDAALAKAERERDSLARRCAVRYEETEKLRSELEAERARAAACSCGTSPMTYEGPEPDCPVHGAVRAFNEAQAQLADLTRQRDEALASEDRSWRLLADARTATKRLTAGLIANASLLDVPFTNEPTLSPWSRSIKPAIDQLRIALGMRGAMRLPCCDLHNRNCEPPSELCCEHCTEAAHPGHADGSVCIAPDLSAAPLTALGPVDPEATAGPRTWTLPPEPGLEVTRVLDTYGQYFERHHDEHPGDDVWIGQVFAGDVDVPDLELEWPMLMAYQAPLTDATPEPGLPVQSCSTCSGRGTVKCLAHQAGDGCDELLIRCPDCRPGSSALPAPLHVEDGNGGAR